MEILCSISEARDADRFTALPCLHRSAMFLVGSCRLVEEQK